MRRVRKRYRVLLLSAIAAALMASVGYALSPDASAARSVAQLTASQATAAAVVTAPMMARARATTAPAPTTALPAVPDAAKLLIVGTSLFGLAAAVRKAH